LIRIFRNLIQYLSNAFSKCSSRHECSKLFFFILRFGHQDNSIRKLHSVVYSLKMYIIYKIRARGCCWKINSKHNVLYVVTVDKKIKRIFIRPYWGCQVTGLDAFVGVLLDIGISYCLWNMSWLPSLNVEQL
jgi:hypothetical protein